MNTKENEMEKIIKKVEFLLDYGKSAYIDGGVTEYPGSKDEKYHKPTIKYGSLNLPHCRICNNNIDKLRNENEKKRALFLCSSDCRNEFKEVMKIKKKLGAVSILWTPSKPPIDKSSIKYSLPEDGWEEIKGIGWKPISHIKWRNYKANKKRKLSLD